jgi:hypothetical protein
MQLDELNHGAVDDVGRRLNLSRRLTVGGSTWVRSTTSVGGSTWVRSTQLGELNLGAVDCVSVCQCETCFSLMPCQPTGILT